MKVDNENGSLINNGTINIMAGATGSVAMYGEKGTISNGKKGVINMGVSGTVMKATDATISNEGTITLANTASTAMRITNNGTAQNAASGTINVNGSNSYALAADDGATATLNNAGTININNGATGSYAMYGKNATLTNETSGTINVLQSGTTAMFTQVGKLTNKGKINLAATDAIGLYVTEGQAVNDSGAIIDVNSRHRQHYQQRHHKPQCCKRLWPVCSERRHGNQLGNHKTKQLGNGLWHVRFRRRKADKQFKY